MKHFRFYYMCMAGGYSFDLCRDDRIYVTMPLYHSAAGILGVGQMLTKGACIVIRKKFSASNFWKDCVKYECTVCSLIITLFILTHYFSLQATQYIGEICRYLLAQPPSADERRHRLRVMFGNGLRYEIWPEFVNRFGVQRLGEFYGSTEGNSNIGMFLINHQTYLFSVNNDNTRGACGFFPIYPFLSRVYPLRLLKIDEHTGEPFRNAQGLCIPCRPGR